MLAIEARDACCRLPMLRLEARNLARSEIVVLEIVAGIVVAIAILCGVILLRRLLRHRWFHRTALRTQAIRRKWDLIVSGEVAEATWYFDAVDHRIVEEMLLDRLDVADPREAAILQGCIRRAGLLDKRIREIRRRRGWRRREAILALGRMQIADGIAALGEAVNDRNEETAIDAVRALGRIATPEAARPILDRLESSRQAAFRCPSPTLQAAIVSCYRGHADRLYADLLATEGDLRAALARALAEVATPDFHGDLLELATDDLAEVRASAARAVAVVRPACALDVLLELARDTEWFVRLRAVVALGELHDGRAAATLLERLCDRNRLVRLRAASALVGLRGKEAWILRLAVGTGDPYALQSLVSELQRSGRVTELVGSLADPRRRSTARETLLQVLRVGAERLLLDLALHHTDRRARAHLSRLLIGSRDGRLLTLMQEQISQGILTRSEQRIVRAMASRLDSQVSREPPVVIPA